MKNHPFTLMIFAAFLSLAARSDAQNKIDLGTQTKGALAGTQVALSQAGVGTIAHTLDDHIKAEAISIIEFLTPAQLADVKANTQSLDVTAAVQAWYTACATQHRACRAVAGTYRLSAPIIFEQAANLSNGIGIFSDAPGQTVFNNSTTSAVPFQLIASGGTVAAPTSSVYASIVGISFQCSYAGACLQIGKPDLSDAINQAYINRVTVQNFNTSAASTGVELNQVLSGYYFLNASTASGPSGGNDIFRIRQADFNHFLLGGSNGQNFAHLTSGFSYGNHFDAPDCEVVGTCFLIDSPSAVKNTITGGTFAYSAYGVNETAGGNNIFLNPNINATVANFMTAGSASYAQLWGIGSFAAATQPIISQSVAVQAASGGNATLALYNGANLGQIYNDTAGNLQWNNGASGAFSVFTQAGNGTFQFNANGGQIAALTAGSATLNTPLTLANGSYTNQISTDAAGNFQWNGGTAGAFTVLSQAGSGTIQFKINGTQIGAMTPLTTVINNKLQLVSGTNTAQLTEGAGGNFTISNQFSGGFTVLSQAGSGTIQQLINSTQVSAQTTSLLTHNTHVLLAGGTPTCGAGCSTIGAGSSDQRMTINSGASVSSVSVNFGIAFPSNPVCVANVSSGTVFPTISAVSGSSVTFSFAAPVTTTLYAQCL